MTRPANPNEAAGDHGFLTPRGDAHPVDHCFRCGVETPPGVGLCEEHNRGRLSGPSSTQMHATIFLGIAAGVIVFFLLASMAVTSSGPYASVVSAATAADDGGMRLAFSVTNEGDDEGVADCRVTRDGVPRPEDYAFRTGVLAAGETVTLVQALPAPPVGTLDYDLETLTITCT